MIELRSELIRQPTDPEAKIQELLPTNLAGNIIRLAAVLTGVKNLKKLEALAHTDLFSLSPPKVWQVEP